MTPEQAVSFIKDMKEKYSSLFPYNNVVDVDYINSYYDEINECQVDGTCVRVLTHQMMGSAGVVIDGVFIDHGAWAIQQQIKNAIELPVQICFTIAGRYKTLKEWDSGR